MNSKFIKTKRNCKLETKFFGPFQVLHPVGKQAYKLELPRNWRIHDVFHVSLLEKDNIRKGRINKLSAPEFEPGDNKEYEVEAIRDSVVYTKKVDGYLPRLYYLVAWKDYPEEKNTWEPSLANYVSPEDGQHFPQGPPREADSDISTSGLRSAHGQANDLAPHKAKARATDRTR